MVVPKVAGKSPEIIFIYCGQVLIEGEKYNGAGSHPCSSDCKGIYLWPDKYNAARVLLIYN
jgi:hypothetical protein